MLLELIQDYLVVEALCRPVIMRRVPLGFTRLCPQKKPLNVVRRLFLSLVIMKNTKKLGDRFEIFHRYTDLVEPMSIDEAYLDVTENKLGLSSAIKIAKLIQYDIWNELHPDSFSWCFL